MKKICIISNDFKDKGLSITNRIINYMKERGCESVVSMTKWDFDKEEWTKPEGIPADAEAILVLGGDGTLIQAARNSYGMHIPLLGINLGTLGFLTEVDCNYLEDALQQLLDGDYAVEDRMMLEGTVITKDGREITSIALNDIVVNRSGSLQIVRFDIWLNNALLKRYNADGCIVSTPTGSTGYNLSAGGPIVEPSAEVTLLTPVCAHTLQTRSVILRAEDRIVIRIREREGKAVQPVEVCFDGNKNLALMPGDEVHITKSGMVTSIIKLKETSFLDVLNRKMSE